MAVLLKGVLNVLYTCLVRMRKLALKALFPLQLHHVLFLKLCVGF